MQLMHRKAFAAIYWVLAFAGTIAGAVLGGHLANGQAPEFGDSTTGASASSHALFAVVGAVVGGLLVLALFAGCWIALWVADRRAHGVTDEEEYGTLDDIEDDLDENEEEREAHHG